HRPVRSVSAGRPGAGRVRLHGRERRGAGSAAARGPGGRRMTSTGRLKELLGQGQSPWLDNLRRGWLTGGELARWVEQGIRGLTSNPSIFQKAISTGHDYDDQFRDVIGGGLSVPDAYWELVVDDIRGALALLRPVYDESDGV